MKGYISAQVEAMHLDSLKMALWHYIYFIHWPEVQDVPFLNLIFSYNKNASHRLIILGSLSTFRVKDVNDKVLLLCLAMNHSMIP